MSTTVRTVSSIFVLDDDPEFNKIIHHVLKKLSIPCEVFTRADDLLSKMSNFHPSLCIIDLNIETRGKGFEIIQKIRSLHGAEIPVFVVSATQDSQLMAHALEMGADDYLLKPLRRDILVSKLTNYLHTDKLMEALSDHQQDPPPYGELSAVVELAMHIQEVDEFGIKIKSPHLISKGTAVALGGNFLKELTGKSRPKLLTATSTWVLPDENAFGAYLEFDWHDEELIQSVRHWIVQKTSKNN